MLLFFFSSRRRHTRSKRDWSSDVCSSDLAGCAGFSARSAAISPTPRSRTSFKSFIIGGLTAEGCSSTRSEERRVGKECRRGGATCQERKIGKGWIGEDDGLGCRARVVIVQ